MLLSVLHCQPLIRRIFVCDTVISSCLPYFDVRLAALKILYNLSPTKTLSAPSNIRLAEKETINDVINSISREIVWQTEVQRSRR